MTFQKQTLRPLFFLFLLICLLTGLVGVIPSSVNAASSSIVISQVYGGGGNAGAPYTNDFVELFNLSSTPVTLTGWSIQYAAATGTTTWQVTPLTNTSLAPGQYYLVQLGSGGAVGSPLPTPDATGTIAMSSTDGKVALVNTATALTGSGCPISASVVDFVGYGAANCSETASAPAPSAAIADIRGFCTDTDNNSSDFVVSAPNPQNSSVIPVACLSVVNVTSTVTNSPPAYTTGAVIPIQITFSNNVDVTGTPTLLLETGVTHEKATYIGGSGTPTLTFNYTVVAGNTSGDLDYVDANSLTLNGGTITGAIGNAILTLPAPGTGVFNAGSLGVNKNIEIDNGLPPTTVSFKRQNPISTPTNADSLIFRVTFSETVLGVDVTDFVATGTIGTPISAVLVSTGVYDVTVSGGDLAGLNGVVGLNLSATPTITDVALNLLPIVEPSIDETYTLDNIPLTVTINQAALQADPANATPINFAVVFSKPIDTTTFTTADITQSGTVTSFTWNILDSGDHINFTLSATAIAPNNRTLIPSIAANRVTDPAGNFNSASTSTDNVVTFNDNVSPTVMVTQAVAQADPTNVLPVNFDVVFSEPINTASFTVADITQSGSATGITWSITDSGDHKKFTLSATAVTGFGTLIPIIAANRVLDLVGNNNIASTSTDNTITYFISPTPTRTSTPGLCGIGSTPTSIIINEVAWAGTAASTTDEWIELYNPTASLVNLNGWILRAVDGTPNIPLSNFNLGPNEYYLLERGSTLTDDTTVSDVNANQIFTGDVGNSNEVLQLYNASGICIDTANSNSGAWPAGNNTTFGTMERRGVVTDSDTAWFTNVNPASWTKHDARGTSSTNYLIHGTPGYANWAISVTATPSPIPSKTSVPTKFKTTTPVPVFVPPPPLIGINEFVPRPGHDWNNDGVVNVGDEYIELLNHGTIDVNLSGYSLDDEANIGSAPYRLPSVTLKPGERMVFYGKDTGLLLSDGGDGVRLIKPNGQLGDAYNYTVVKYPDQAYCRLPDNGGLDDWTTNCFPTPGLKNSLSGSFPNPPSGGNADQSSCPISDMLPDDFAWAECPSFGNIWSRFYWDAQGWFGEKTIPDDNSKWDVYVD